MEGGLFIGMGNNPYGLDLPEGFGTRLAQDPHALHNFANLSQQEKDNLVRYMQQAPTGEDSLFRVTNAVKQLGEGHVQQILMTMERDSFS